MAPRRASALRWARDNYGLLLALTRGLANLAAVSFALTRAGHPPAAALAEGGAAGALSALLQWTPVNERYGRFLCAARGETRRFLRWAAVSTTYYLLMKLAGCPFLPGRSLAGLSMPGTLLALALGTAQYPWVAAIALRRARAERAAARRSSSADLEDVRFVADLQTLAVSAFFVSLGASSAIGVGASRLLLVGAGLAGAACYRALKRPAATTGETGWRAASSSLTMRAVDSAT